jgi:hypothetical protein
MSMRQSVGKPQIEQFLIQVGRTRQSGRLYLTGGAALVHRGIRPGQTLDIDIQVTGDPANLTVQIAQLKQRIYRCSGTRPVMPGCAEQNWQPSL